MKKTGFVAAVVLLLIFSCHKKSVPSVSSRTKQPPAPAKAPRKVYPAAEIAAGKVVYEGKCAKCHSPKAVDVYTIERWASIMKSMIPKSKLDSAQKVHVMAYVNTYAKK